MKILKTQFENDEKAKLKEILESQKPLLKQFKEKQKEKVKKQKEERKNAKNLDSKAKKKLEKDHEDCNQLDEVKFNHQLVFDKMRQIFATQI